MESITLEQLADKLHVDPTKLRLIMEKFVIIDCIGMQKTRKWRESTFVDAVLHSQGRLINADADRPKDTDMDMAVIVFADGTAIGCYSRWKGPYSDVTPDVDTADPGWKIYD